MERPWLLDLFCGAGGAGEGYRRAGFHVVGVDINPKPLRHNPHEWYVGDALEVLNTLLAGRVWEGYTLHDFDAIHASPPCQGYSSSRHISDARFGRRAYPLLIAPIRERLQATGRSWVIENVSRSPMGSFLRLCGTHFGLRVYRHRQFESSELLMAPGPCSHPAKLLPGYVCVYGHHVRESQTGNRGNHYVRCQIETGRAAMGIDWMTQAELSQAIPPPYTEWIGRQLRAAISTQEVA